ncbi:MAG: hypothetical protein OEW77_10540 [Gemmatimonadota bacterium]|nr:hypothetical protein [Gemmatimonadota bacterium]
MRRFLLGLAIVGGAHAARAQPPADPEALRHSVEQLRSIVGRWNVETEYLDDDGSVARAVRGTYDFTWVILDRVISGKSEIPELQQVAGILFYVNTAKRIIEMVSVGGDGRLWVMTGPLGGEARTTPPFATAGGGSAQLRFTRFNVTSDLFESRMEYTEDGGQTWKPGNHQTFRRAPSPAP